MVPASAPNWVWPDSTELPSAIGQQADPVLCVRDFELEQKPSDEGDRQKTRYRDRR